MMLGVVALKVLKIIKVLVPRYKNDLGKHLC